MFLKIIRFSEKYGKQFYQKTSSSKEIKLYHQAHTTLLQKGFDRLLCLDQIHVTPKPWQEETALKVLNDMQGDAILADEVGLGKTIEAGLIMKELLVRGLIKKILVLVPAPLLEQWKEEMQEKFELHFVDYKERGWNKSNLVISSMTYAARSKYRREQLQNVQFDLVVVDEAHSLKNHKTATYKFVYGIKRKNTILMSATPIQNDLKELFNLVNILKPGHFKSRKLFSQEYIADRFEPKNVKKLKGLISEVMIRHKRSNTLVELPRRNVEDIEIVLGEKERKFHHDVIEFCRDLYNRDVIGGEGEGKTVLTFIGLLKQNCSSPQSVIKYIEKNIKPKLYAPMDKKRCEELIEEGKSIAMPMKMKRLLEKIQSSNEQCIVYSEFIETIDLIEKCVTEHGIKALSYHGSMNLKQKEEILRAFKKGECQVLISSESGSQGLNLQNCHILYNYDLPWNPMRVEQRIGRIHRFGQKNEVWIYTMTTKGTIDEYILYILTSKVKLFQMVIGELDTIMSYMLDDNSSIEVRIGRTILEARNADEIEENLRKIGQELVKAKKDFKWDQSRTKKLLEVIEVGEE